jgi:hypothetical protein
MEYYVYVYLDPRRPGNFTYGSYHFDHEPFYAGKGKGRRDKAHLSETSLSGVNPFKNNKIRKIVDSDLSPIIIRLAEELTDAEALQGEIEAIAIIGRSDLGNGPLTNLTDGGESTTGMIYSEASRALMSSQRKGKKQTPAQYAANCSRVATEEHKKKISDALKGRRILTDEHYQAIAEKNRGQTRSQETRELLSKQRKGKKQTTAQYEANLRKIDNFDWMTYEEFKIFVSSIDPQHHTARNLHKYIKEKRPPRVPNGPYAVYKLRGVWKSWDDVFGR